MKMLGLPLAGVSVVEFCEVAAGPFCGMQLADMGADVVKVERPAGDSLRQWPPVHNGYSENFASLNRNKRSVVLDLTNAEDRTNAQVLAASCDVLIENYRPGVLGKYGLDYASLAARNPALVYCSISAFGQTGPRRAQGGFDLTLQALSGIMSVTGEVGGAPVKCGVPICDFATGLYGAFAIASCLRTVAETGKGVHLDVSMLGASLGIAALQTSEYFGTGKDPQRLGSAHPRNAPYEAYEAQDGHFVMAASTDKLWRQFCRLIERQDLNEDERFSSTARRARNQLELRKILQALFISRPAEEWLERLSAGGVPCAAINRYSEVLGDAQVTESGWIENITLPGGHRTQTVVSPIRVNERTLGVYRDPPALGQHTEEVLGEITVLGDRTSRRRD